MQIKRLGEKKRDENGRFRKYMKSRVFVERQFRKAAEEVTDAIDCRQCAECCRVTDVQIVERDIQKLSHFLDFPKKLFSKNTRPATKTTP